MIEVFGARVRQARLLRRMTATSVVGLVGWSNARQTKIEKSSTIMLSVDEVAGLSELFRFPARFFSSEPQSRVSAGELLFRWLSSQMRRCQPSFSVVVGSRVWWGR